MCHPFYNNPTSAIGNGGKTDKYVWIQQLADLTVNVPVPEGTKTKMLDVKITNTKLYVSLFWRFIEKLCTNICFVYFWLFL